MSQLQQIWYEDVPILQVGDAFGLIIKNGKVHSPGLASLPRYLFNTWLSR